MQLGSFGCKGVIHKTGDNKMLLKEYMARDTIPINGVSYKLLGTLTVNKLSCTGFSFAQVCKSYPRFSIHTRKKLSRKKNSHTYSYIISAGSSNTLSDKVFLII